jgi:putative transposase
MSKRRFSSGARFRWQETTYQIVHLLPGRQVNIENILTGATSVVEISTLVHALFAAALDFVSENTPVLPDAQAQNGIIGPHLSLSDYPAKLVIVARYRLEVIRPLLEMKNRTRSAVLVRVQEIKTAHPESGEHTLQDSVSAAAIYRWICDYERSGNDIRALIPAVHERGGKQESRLHSETETLVEMVIQDKYKVHEKVTIEDIRCELAVRVAEENQVRPVHDQLTMPSRATLARRIEASATYQDHKKQRSRSSVKRSDVQCGQTPYPNLPLERVEIDHTHSDLVVIDDRDDLPLGRLTLTYCLDTATRYPLGYYLGFEPPSYLTVMECLHHAIQPKEEVRKQYGTQHEWLGYGIPATLVIDNGKEFIGHDLEDSCLLLGIVLQYSPVRMPQFKAGAERMFGSMNTMFFHTLPGTTFSNPGERGSYNSAGQACVYLSEVDRLLNLFLVDIYAERFHQGLNGIPARAWEEKVQHGFTPALPPSAEELSVLLGRTTTRVIHPYGIEFASLRYNSDDLLSLRTRLKGQAAKIKYHPADLSCLYVFDMFEQQYIRLPALDQEYTQGLSLWKHRIIRQAVLEVQDQVDLVALGKAKRKIQQIVDASRQRKHQSSRTRIARWDTAGQPTRQATGKTESGDKMPVATAKESGSTTSLLLSGDDDNWEIDYAPLRHADTQPADEEQVQNG